MRLVIFSLILLVLVSCTDVNRTFNDSVREFIDIDSRDIDPLFSVKDEQILTE